MILMSDLNIKAYDVDTEGNIREWELDKNTFYFKTVVAEYSANNMDQNAIVVKVSPIKDKTGIPIEEGQRIVDIHRVEYEVKYNALNGFVAVNEKTTKNLKDVSNPKIIRICPHQIFEMAEETTCQLHELELIAAIEEEGEIKKYEEGK